MSRLDLVIFGATGFTGKKAVEETVRVAKKYPGLTWAVAGRSQKKLEELLSEVSKITGENLSSIKVFIADVKDEKSLKDMCAQAKVVVNCCGPYRLYGEPVVKAAIDSKAHYVDVSGEPQFMETMQLVYGLQARDAGVYVIGACGFDSIPNDMGVVFLQQNFDGTLNSVESYLNAQVAPEYSKEVSIGGVLHYGTWESLVHGLAHHNELAPLRKKLYPERLPSFKPKLDPRPLIHKYNGKWCLPFPGADNAIVYRTQRYMYEKEKRRPVQFKAYVSFASLFTAVLTFLSAVIIYIFSMTSFTRKLLLNHPRLFSFGLATHEGPTANVMNNTHFTFELIGEGWDNTVTDVDATPPNKKVYAKVTGVNPGYGATVTALLYSAITVLKQQDKLPQPGGVLTSGAAFKNTDLIKNLNENNFKFEIIENRQ